MKKLLFVASGLLLVACEQTTQQYLYMQGASVAEADNAYFQCDVEAANAVPQNTRIGTTPTYTTPVQTNCYNIGNSVQCNTTGGQVSGGQSYSYDANSELRAKFWAKCMVNKGVTEVIELPACDVDAVPQSVVAKLRGLQRPPQPGACYYPITDDVGNVVYQNELVGTAG